MKYEIKENNLGMFELFVNNIVVAHSSHTRPLKLKLIFILEEELYHG
jgi:hypothetical protein